MINKSILIILPAVDFSVEEYLVIKRKFEKEKIHLFIASTTTLLCTGDTGLKVSADVSLYNIHETNFSAVLFLGGKGIRNYWDNSDFQSVAGKFYNSNKIVAAICSAPVILARAGMLNNKKATCYPIDKKEIEIQGSIYVDENVVVDDRIITAQNPASAIDFADAIINQIKITYNEFT